ncbi:hypothetical protein CEXT_285411 [Caerostris extrusa]|uniref:Uncharacterized protein n=1 Tax=Caerostris extrusa TaxID=172846 RepID=A0AAV4P813_CAEEX|nr:hypothetical protein CEXT_285411 [Caerostris extrusa]
MEVGMEPGFDGRGGIGEKDKKSTFEADAFDLEERNDLDYGIIEDNLKKRGRIIQNLNQIIEDKETVKIHFQQNHFVQEEILYQNMLILVIIGKDDGFNSASEYIGPKRQRGSSSVTAADIKSESNYGDYDEYDERSRITDSRRDSRFNDFKSYHGQDYESSISTAFGFDETYDSEFAGERGGNSFFEKIETTDGSEFGGPGEFGDTSSGLSVISYADMDRLKYKSHDGYWREDESSSATSPFLEGSKILSNLTPSTDRALSILSAAVSKDSINFDHLTEILPFMLDDIYANSFQNF